jgi:hypothetical protein
MSLKKTSCGARSLSLCGTVSASFLGPFSSRQRLHWTGPVSCWHHYHLNTADVVSVRAHSVSAVLAPLSSCCTKDSCHAHDEHKDDALCLISLACPRIAHGHTPAAALDRSTSSFEPGESCFPHPPTPLLLARSRRRAELHHRDHSDYRVSLRSDRAKPTIFETLFKSFTGDFVFHNYLGSYGLD